MKRTENFSIYFQSISGKMLMNAFFATQSNQPRLTVHGSSSKIIYDHGLLKKRVRETWNFMNE